MARQTTVHAVLTAIRGKPHVREVLVRCGVVAGKVSMTEEIDTKAPLSTTKRLKAELKSKNLYSKTTSHLKMKLF